MISSSSAVASRFLLVPILSANLHLEQAQYVSAFRTGTVFLVWGTWSDQRPWINRANVMSTAAIHKSKSLPRILHAHVKTREVPREKPGEKSCSIRAVTARDKNSMSCSFPIQFSYCVVLRAFVVPGAMFLGCYSSCLRKRERKRCEELPGRIHTLRVFFEVDLRREICNLVASFKGRSSPLYQSEKMKAMRFCNQCAEKYSS